MKNFSAIILAAGFSKRFGEDNKLLADLNGKPVISHTLDKIAQLPFSKRIVVINPEQTAIKSLCDPSRFQTVENQNAADGMGTSIAAGVSAASNANGVAVILGDMPNIRQDTYEILITACEQGSGQTIVVPSHQGQRGHPVFFSNDFFHELTALTGDKGANSVIEKHHDCVRSIAVNDPGILSDIDTQAALLKAKRNNG